ncbi:FtsX-like permease family protein [Dactylosporangium sp. NPDC051485]|uniref:FtsX-like permease family protein n=1 Tax=Dactylosporangium sp. NPDC051485 TaxID=3154846 RepID=UPI003431C9AE
MTPATLLRLAVAGTRADTLRIALTACGALLGTLALLAAATVLAIPTLHDPANPYGVGMAPYTNGLLREPGLRPGLAFALVMLSIPVLLFVGQCARLGAPARDRRLAAIRLAGATPRQGLAVAAAESGVATLVGTALGLLVYLVGRRLLDAPDAQNLRPLPTDVLPHWAALAGVVLGLPMIATLATTLLLRRVTVTPLGVVRRVRTGSPRPWPGMLIVLGIAAYALLAPAQLDAERHGSPLPAPVVAMVLFLGGLGAAIGVVGGTGWISYAVGGLLSRYARRPAALIAGRRLQADPWSGSRALAALLAAVLFAGGAAWVSSWFRTRQRVEAKSQHLVDLAAGQQDIVHPPNDFYLRTMQLVGYAVLVAGLIAAAGLAVTVASSVVERRRTLASLTASGVPRSVLGRAILWQTLSVAAPALVLAVGTGVALGRGLLQPTVVNDSSSITTCAPPPDKADVCDSTDPAERDPYTRIVTAPKVSEQVRIPWADLVVIGGWATGATTLVAGLGLVFLRASTAPEELRTT